jgi:ParB-like chromosome segregation protein Spo0J
MEHDFEITQARIAAREGLSRARVTQLMNLLELPEEIQRDLQIPPPPLEIYSFSERRLRQLLTCGNRESQLRRWQELVRECQILVRK